MTEQDAVEELKAKLGYVTGPSPPDGPCSGKSHAACDGPGSGDSQCYWGPGQQCLEGPSPAALSSIQLDEEQDMEMDRKAKCASRITNFNTRDQQEALCTNNY